MQKIHSIIKKKNTWSDNRNVLVCVWCSSLFEWASLQITLLWEKLILTADNQTETRRLGINQQQSPSIHFDCPPHSLWIPKETHLWWNRLFWLQKGLGWLLVCVVCVHVSWEHRGRARYRPVTQLEQSSQHLPLKSKHNVDHLQAAGDFFQDAVLLPQLV